MAAIKSYTDLQQSKKLAEILPLESADMFYNEEPDETYPKNIVDTKYPMIIRQGQKHYLEEYGIPCWSLAALLKLIPNFNVFKRTIECKIETTNHSIDKACDLIDAAFEMICWLKENNEL